MDFWLIVMDEGHVLYYYKNGWTAHILMEAGNA